MRNVQNVSKKVMKQVSKMLRLRYKKMSFPPGEVQRINLVCLQIPGQTFPSPPRILNFQFQEILIKILQILSLIIPIILLFHNCLIQIILVYFTPHLNNTSYYVMTARRTSTGCPSYYVVTSS